MAYQIAGSTLCDAKLRRLQPSAPEDAVLMPVEVGTVNTDVAPSVPEPQRRSIETSPSQVMEITLENGRKLSVSDGL